MLNRSHHPQPPTAEGKTEYSRKRLGAVLQDPGNCWQSLASFSQTQQNRGSALSKELLVVHIAIKHFQT